MLETEPRDLLLDKYNDLVVTTDLAWSDGIPGVMQECRIKLQMFRGEWFLNLDVGIPYWSHILGQKPNLAVAAIGASFAETLLTVEDVIEVVKINVVYEGKTRSLKVTWQVRCEFGTTPVDTLVLGV